VQVADAQMITSRGTGSCRACGSGELVSVLDLGEQPLANELGRSAADVVPAFPLHLRICASCGLGQVGEFVMPERIFGDDYPYLSSTSSTWVDHARTYAAHLGAELRLSRHDLVIEIASNDGCVLRQFQERGLAVLGIEPAQNVAQIAEASGVPTRVAFFGAEVAAEVVKELGHPRLVTANNVMAHVPDLLDFAAGLAILADDRTVITVENPSIMSLLGDAQFDTIYHEHYSYLSAHAVRAVVRAQGLDLVRVEQVPTHGGSNRYWISAAGDPDDSVARVLDQEISGGLFDPDTWDLFASRSRAAVGGLRAWLDQAQSDGRAVAGYGAAAKGNTFLNAVGETARVLQYVVDGSIEKQGRFLPGSQIPILEPDSLRSRPVDDVLLLPWNIADELAALVAERLPDARTWVALPEMRRIS